jgi:predicted permease
MADYPSDAPNARPGEDQSAGRRLPAAPPRWVDRLLERLLPLRLLEDVQGDLHEVFYRQARAEGAAKARRAYLLAVLAYLRPFYLQRKPNPYPNPAFMDMLRHHITVAFRQVIRNKAFSLINVLGLALGLTCSLLIFLWVRDEVSMDRYHANGPHLYRVMERQLYDGKREVIPNTPGQLTLELPRKFPEIVHAAGFSWPQYAVFEAGGKINKEQGRWVGADYFKMFSVPLLVGSPQQALVEPNSVVLSRKLAENYFGSPGAAVGKSIRFNNEDEYLVTGVFENIPENTSDKYDFLLSWNGFLKRNEWLKDWGNNSPQAYVQLRPDTDVKAFEAKLKHFLRGYNPNIDPQHPEQFDIELFLQPFEDQYLYSEFDNGEQAGGRIAYVRLFSLVAVFLLLIAAINFMNLATARSARRAKEVGIRKVVGAGRFRLIGQFMGEALLLTFMAVGVALAGVGLLLPAFNQLTGKQIAHPFAQPGFAGALLGMGLVTGLLAGSYPALFLSSLQPIRVLKGMLAFKPGAAWLRQGLVVVQFVISMLLILGTFVVYRQVEYIRTKNLGFDRENLVYVQLDGELRPKFSTLEQELQRLPGVLSYTRMGQKPHDMDGNTHSVEWKGKDPAAKIMFTTVAASYRMADALKVKMRAGRDFSPKFATDSAGYIINEEAARRMGYRNPVGQPLTLWDKPGTIIGVVQDFHFQSLHEPVKPLIIRFNDNSEWGYVLVRTQPGQTQQTLSRLEALCKKLEPKFPFTYFFADQQYEQLYRSEQVIGSLANSFALLAIFIACLGLFGLAAFTAQQRTKEIGIRKVLGASVGSLVGLLSKDFVRLVLIAILIASPLGGWLMHQWLKNYEYRITISWWMYLVAGLLAVGIALLTVSFQSIKAALADPVKSLRSE